MAKEYIDRERMIRCFCAHCISEGTEECVDCYDKRLMQNFPAADVRENVKARWEEDILDGLPGYRPVVIVCSNCHRVSMAGFSYCPNCGAQMGGAEDGSV